MKTTAWKFMLVFLLSLLFLESHAIAATITAADCSQTAVQSAVNSAKDGDIVMIPAGSATWASAVTWQDKNISVLGAGMDKTTIIPTGQAFIVSMTTGSPGKSSAGTSVLKVSWRLSGMSLTGTSVVGTGRIILNSTTCNQPVMGWRIDHIKVSFTTQTRGIMVNGVTWGLIDHCQFIGNNLIAVTIYANLNNEWTSQDGGVHEGDYSWSLPLNLGSDEAVYIEDCEQICDSSNIIGGINDMAFGASMVVRHCTITAGYFLAHASQGYHRGGSKKFEVYNNTWIGDGFIWPMAIQENGTGVIFNNTVSGYKTNRWVLGLYRATSADYAERYYGNCTDAESWKGTSPKQYDGLIESTGWPCMDQVGRGSGVAPGEAQPSVPLLLWNNGPQETCASGGECDGSVGVTLNGTPVDHAPLSNYISKVAHSNGDIDYCDGGTAMPTICGNYKNNYAPLAYPHPLQAQSDDVNIKPPSNLRINQ